MQIIRKILADFTFTMNSRSKKLSKENPSKYRRVRPLPTSPVTSDVISAPPPGDLHCIIYIYFTHKTLHAVTYPRNMGVYYVVDDKQRWLQVPCFPTIL